MRPSRVDRGVLTRVAGSMQTWLITALRHFALIDEQNVPTPKLDALATATDEQRPKLLADMLRAGYPFLFNGDVDLSNITYSDLKKKFEETGAQGETAVKAITFFTGMAKMADIDISPFVATRQRRAGNGRRGGTKRAPQPPAPPPPPPTPPPTPPPGGPAGVQMTPMQVLIEMLDIKDMDQDEQAAVWTLIRYLKRKAGS